jgi:putative oxidoreductase
MEVLNRKSLTILRISLGIVFLWFGVLKLFTSSPSLSLLQNALPFEMATSQLFSFFVALFEIALGVSFLANKLDRIAAIAAAVSLLLVTLLVLVTSGFDPRFPVLSIAGESVLKNLVLIAGCLVLISDKNPTVVKDNVLKKSQ